MKMMCCIVLGLIMDNASVISVEDMDGAVCCIHTVYFTVVVISLMMCCIDIRLMLWHWYG